MLRKSGSLKQDDSKEENSTPNFKASDNLDSEFLKTLLGRLYKRKYDLKSTGTTLVLFGSQLETRNTEPCNEVNHTRRRPATVKSKSKSRPVTSSVYSPSNTNYTYTRKYNIKYTSTRLIVLDNKCKKQGASRILKSLDTDQLTDRHSTVDPNRHLPWIRPSSFKERHSLCRSNSTYSSLKAKSITKPPDVKNTRPKSWHIGTFLHEVRSSVNPHRHRNCLPDSDTQSQPTTFRPMEFYTSTPVPGRTLYHSPYSLSLSRSES